MEQGTHAIRVEVAAGDALTAAVDVLALKHAQGFYGADGKAAALLGQAGVTDVTAPEGGFRLVASRGAVTAGQVLFIGVASLYNFRYGEIREFGARVLSTLAREAPAARSVALTIHGPGYGLDESESFLSEVAGLTDAIAAGDYPPSLQAVTIVERDTRRAALLRDLLDDHLPGGTIRAGAAGAGPGRRAPRRRDDGAAALAAFDGFGGPSEHKPHIFVAMPFADDLGDLFHYGISRAISDAGYLCERVDAVPSVGDVLARIKERIRTAAFVIAELTGGNPNVYLEVGYAWGCGVPTILLVRQAQVGDLYFDIQGQRCLTYTSIRDLEQKLCRELAALKAHAAER